MSDQNFYHSLRQDAQEMCSCADRSNKLVAELSEDLNKINLSLQTTRQSDTSALVATTTTTTNSEGLSRSRSDPKTLNELRRLALGKNQRIQDLKSENAELKLELLEHQMAIEMMMVQYRKQMDLLGQVQHCHRSLEDYESGARAAAEAEVIAAVDRLQSMVETSGKVFELTESKLLELRETMTQLRTEHQGLLEMYRIARQFGSVQNQSEPKGVEKEVEEEENSTPSPPTIIESTNVNESTINSLQH